MDVHTSTFIICIEIAVDFKMELNAPSLLLLKNTKTWTSKIGVITIEIEREDVDRKLVWTESGEFCKENG